MPEILFVCTANRYRSPIAEACLKVELVEHNQDQAWNVASAGTWAQDGLPAMSEAIQKAEQLDLDIGAHRSQAITPELLLRADLILVMTQGHKEALQIEFKDRKKRILLLSEAAENLSYDIPDPVLDPTLGDIAADICSLIRGNYERIIELAKSGTVVKDTDN